MRLRPNVVAAIVLSAAAALSSAGCGTADAPEADQQEPVATAPTSPGGGSGASPTATASPAPAGTPTRTEGDGDSEGDDTPATAGGGICSDLEPAAVGRILGSTTTGAALPGGGCEFTQTAAKGAAAAFVEKSVSKTPGGMAGAKTEATSSVEGEPQDLSGIGDAAFVVTGTAFGEPAIRGAGAVKVGTRIISVNLTQNSGMSAGAVKAMVVDLLELAADRAS